MEISIDTKKDSPEDIRKAIEFLKMFLETNSNSQELMREATNETGIGNDSSGEITSGMVDMFGNTLAEKKESSKKKYDDDIRIIPY
jgi:hypothetical protein